MCSCFSKQEHEHPSWGDSGVEPISQLLFGTSTWDSYPQDRIVVFARSNLASGWIVLNYTQEMILFSVVQFVRGESSKQAHCMQSLLTG